MRLAAFLQSSPEFNASTFSLLDDSFGLLPAGHPPDRWSRFIDNVTKMNDEADDLTTYKVRPSSPPFLRHPAGRLRSQAMWRRLAAPPGPGGSPSEEQSR